MMSCSNRWMKPKFRFLGVDSHVAQNIPEIQACKERFDGRGG
jgi:hypothetical protein